MDPNRREEEDLQRDDTLFPAYTDYLYGVDMRPHVSEEAGLHPDLYLPEWATTTHPIRTRPSETMIFKPLPTTTSDNRTTVSDGSHVIDLWSPRSHPGVLLVAPESVVPAPVQASHALLTHRNLMTLTQLSSTELTRRKLLKAAPAGIAPSSSLGDLRPLGTDIPTTLPARDPTQDAVRNRMPSNPFQLQSNLKGLGMPASMYGQHGALQAHHSRASAMASLQLTTRAPQAPTLLQHQQQQMQPPVVSRQAPFQPQNGRLPTAHPQIDLIRPGELLQNPHFTTALGPHAQQVNINLAQHWRAAATHPNPSARDHAMQQIRAISAFTYQRVRARLQQTSAWVNSQDPVSGANQGLYRAPTQQVPVGGMPQPRNGVLNGLTGLDGTLPQPTMNMRPHPAQAQATATPDSQPHGISPIERAFIDNNIQTLFATSNYAYREVDESDVVGMQQRTKALGWIDMFKAKLSPAGHEYLNQIMADQEQAQRVMAGQQRADTRARQVEVMGDENQIGGEEVGGIKVEEETGSDEQEGGVKL